jgi:hypothetical protein
VARRLLAITARLHIPLDLFGTRVIAGAEFGRCVAHDARGDQFSLIVPDECAAVVLLACWYLYFHLVLLPLGGGFPGWGISAYTAIFARGSAGVKRNREAGAGTLVLLNFGTFVLGLSARSRALKADS